MTWQRAEDERTKELLINSPRRLAKLTIAWPFSPIANVTVHSGRLWERAEIRWSIYNLADVAYFDSPSEEHLDSLGRNLTETRLDGRSYLASVVFTF